MYGKRVFSPSSISTRTKKKNLNTNWIRTRRVRLWTPWLILSNIYERNNGTLTTENHAENVYYNRTRTKNDWIPVGNIRQSIGYTVFMIYRGFSSEHSFMVVLAYWFSFSIATFGCHSSRPLPDHPNRFSSNIFRTYSSFDTERYALVVAQIVRARASLGVTRIIEIYVSDTATIAVESFVIPFNIPSSDAFKWIANYVHSVIGRDIDNWSSDRKKPAKV